MQLPFTEEQFLDVFGRYNAAFWMAALLLWLASLAVALEWLRRRRPPEVWVGWLLVVLWLWGALAYHALYFVEINPAAYVFGALFFIEALLLTWAVLSRRLRFDGAARAWNAVGAALVVYALLYPFVTRAFGLRYPRMPTYGVPCPTTLFTVGFLLAASPSAPRLLGVVPLIWCVIGGSGALLLGVPTDWMLVLAGALLLVRMLVPGSRSQLRPA